MNVGLWLSIELVTADTLTLGLALLAVYLSLRHRPAWAAVAMTLAVLAKETSILFAAGLVIWLYIDGQRGAVLRMAVLLIGAIATWMLYLESVLGGAFKSNSNLGRPFVGMIQSMGMWSGTAQLYGWMAVVSLVMALIGVWWARSRLLTAITVPWVLVAVASSTVVWEDGNNALRVLSPSWTLGVLGLAIAIGRREPTHG